MIRARGLYGHLDSTIVKPDKPNANLDTSPAGPEGAAPPTEGPKQLTAEQVGLIEKYTKELNEYLQEQAIFFQQIALTIPDSLYLKIKGKPTVKEAWVPLKADFERSHMITIEL